MPELTPCGHYAALRRALEREYRLSAVLEETAHGAAYVGHDLVLDRRVVIRAVDPALAEPARTEAFQREARVLASLKHPSIPSVHHAGTVAGCFHLVLEHRGTESLAARLRAGPLARDEVVRLGVQLLGALETVHRSGLVHGGVTPEIVLVGNGRYVLDGFGSAVSSATEDARQEDLRAAAAVLAAAAQGTGPGARRLPRRLRPVLRRAQSAGPSERWRSAGEFRAALERAGQPAAPLVRLSAAALAVVVLLGGVRGVAAWIGENEALVPPPRELAILPFEVDGGPALDRLGARMTHLLQLDLEDLPGLALTPRGNVDRWFEAHGGDAVGVDKAAAARDLQAHWVAHGLVERRAGDTLRLRITLHDSLGTRSVLPELRGSEHDLAALGDSLALRIIRVVAPRADSLYEPVAGLAAVPLPALRAFLHGEAAFARDAWAEAQRHYEIALGHDSTFALAEWRLSNVRRWRRLPFEHDLRDLHRRHAGRLRARDRMLLEALLQPDLRLRFALLDTVVHRFPGDGYARLIQGEELFHRGPRAGVGLEHATAAMAAAVARDPSLALAHDHLVLAAARAGRRDEAARALALRRRVGIAPRPDDIDLLPFLELVHDERFAPWRASIRHRLIRWREDPRQLAGIEKVARMGTSWLDMPYTQLRYCDLLLRVGSPSAETFATAHEGKGLAYFALGRPRQALAQLDSAAALLDSPEARLQQAEWRVLPPALGLPEVEADDGRGRLEELAGDPGVGARAAWALALAEHAAGDSAAAGRWTARVPAGSPLRALLDARAEAARGNLAGALALTDSVRLAFEVTRPLDAFAGAAFHLLRGHWYSALGDRARADAERIWYEASDAEGWYEGLAQAGEVDAALGVFARLERGRGLLAHSASPADTALACTLLDRVVELWSDAEPVMRPLVSEAAELRARCPR